MKTLHINGINVTSYLTPWGYTVSHVKRDGGNGGQMRDGSITEDTLAIKAVIAVPCMPLTESSVNFLTTLLLSQQYAYVRFWDTNGGEYRLAECVYTPYEATEKGRGADGNIYWTGMAIKLEER